MKYRVLFVVAFTMLCISALDLFAQVRKVPVFPDTLVGRKLVGVLRYKAEELPGLLKEKAELLLEYRCLNLYIASYVGKRDEGMTIELYEFESSLEAFGLFSVVCDSVDFNGQPDYAVSKISNRIQINLGTYVGFIYSSNPESKVEIPARVVDDIFFILNGVTSLELLKIPLPFDERARGSIRFIQGREAWRLLENPVIDFILPSVDTVTAYYAEYRKKRLRIKRDVFAFTREQGRNLDTLYSAIYKYLDRGGKLHGKKGNVAWFDISKKQVHLVKMPEKLLLVIATEDDPGAFEWLIYLVSKETKL